MIRLGDWNRLSITRFTDHGAYLDGGEQGEILMPKAYVRREMKPGDTTRVFVYHDQSGRLVATMEHPLARVGDFASLRVAWTNRYGAFMDWGLMKDLFVPFREQKRPLRQGDRALIYVYIDQQSGRIVGTTKIEKHLQPVPAGEYERGDEVEVLVMKTTPLGLKVIVDNLYEGLIYANSVFGAMPRIGDTLRGVVSSVRPDGKIDISPDRLGVDRFRDFADILLDELKAAGGRLPYADHSTPEEIAERFNVSKKTFKRAIGTLYRAQLIKLFDREIVLVR
ncbi:MAG: S1-like domain-containing RNA-binding protein [Alloprevotella sp.]|nr:S1-like domain-containing RNA-binding protein [Alloprevotella sp.]